MRVERVSYQELLPTAPYLNSRIGVDYLLEEGDDPKAALQAAKGLVHEFHREKHPEMYIDEASDTPYIKTVAQGEKEPEKLSQTEWIIHDISTCSDIKVLESYKLIAKTNPDIQHAYNIKEIQLR